MEFIFQLATAAGLFAAIEWIEGQIRRRFPGRSNLRYALLKLGYGLPLVVIVFGALLGAGIALQWTAIAAGVLAAALLALIFFGDDE